MAAILWAFGALTFTAANDLLFKLFKKKKTPMGGFVAVVGLIGFIVCFLTAHPDFSHHWKPTIVWGIISGFLSVSANLLLIDAMRFQSAGVVSTIYRFNMVLVVVGAVICFGESLTFLQCIGIVCTFAAVILFFPEKHGIDPRQRKYAVLGLTLALFACLLRGVMGLTFKQGTRLLGDSGGMTLITNAWWFVGGLLWYFFRERSQKQHFLNGRITFYGACSGVFVFAILFATLKMLSYGQASITLPLAQMSFAPTFLMSVIFLHEKLTVRKIFGILFAVAGVLLLALPN